MEIKDQQQLLINELESNIMQGGGEFQIILKNIYIFIN
jgi:hypothetical protein